jgi:hypothetical protein
MARHCSLAGLHAASAYNRPAAHDRSEDEQVQDFPVRVRVGKIGACERKQADEGEARGARNTEQGPIWVATGWTECLPLVTRDGSFVVEAMKHVQSLFPWLLLGVDFDNDSAFMNDTVVPWCREQKLEVTRSRAYKKNDQAFVEQKNGAVVRRLMGYGRFEGVETARVMGRLYAAARLFVNFFQPSFKLKEKRREGAKVIKRYHAPSTPYERALAHPKLSAAVKQRLRDQYRTLNPVALLAEIRAAQEELGNRIDRRAGDARGQQRAGKGIAPQPVQSSTPDAVAFAKTLGTTIEAGEPRATHRRPKRPYKTRVRMPSKLDPHVATIEGVWPEGNV